MYQPVDKWRAREEEFKEMAANDERRRRFFRQLRDHFPDACAALLNQLDGDWDARVVEETAAVAPLIAELPEGELDPEPDPME